MVPETVEAIRALTGIVEDGRESIGSTDGALGMRRDFIAG